MPEVSETAIANQVTAKQKHRQQAEVLDAWIRQHVENTSPQEVARPVDYDPGSHDKIVTLAARYHHGLPLYWAGDCLEFNDSNQIFL